MATVRRANSSAYILFIKIIAIKYLPFLDPIMYTVSLRYSSLPLYVIERDCFSLDAGGVESVGYSLPSSLFQEHLP